MTEGFRMGETSSRDSESVYRSGFLQAWISGFFLTREDGRRIFYLQGAHGRRGYVIVSTEQEMILRANVRGFQRLQGGILFVLMLFFSGLLASQPSWQLLLTVLASWPLLWVLGKAYFWRFTRTMEPVHIANSPMTHWRSMGRTVNPALLIVQMIFVVAISGATLYRAYENQDPVLLLIGMMVAAGLFPFAVAMWSWRQTWMSVK